MVEQRNRQGREQRRKDRERKRQGKEGEGEAEKGLRPTFNLLVTPEGQHPEFAGHLNPVEARTGQAYSCTVGTGVGVPVRSGDGRGERPGYDDDKCMTTGGAIFKELTPIATRPGWPHGGTTNSADCGTGRWSLKRDRVDEPFPFPPPAPIVFPLGTSDGLAPNKAVIELKMPLVQSGSIPADLGGSKKGVCGMRLQEMGSILGESLQEVMLLCSQPTGGESRVGVHLKQTDTFPLPSFQPSVNFFRPYCQRSTHGPLIG